MAPMHARWKALRYASATGSRVPAVERRCLVRALAGGFSARGDQPPDRQYGPDAYSGGGWAAAHRLCAPAAKLLRIRIEAHRSGDMPPLSAVRPLFQITFRSRRTR